MGRRRKHRRNKWLVIIASLAAVWVVQESRFYFPKYIRPPAGVEPVTVEMKTTSYCHCRRCCSYKWLLVIPYQKTGRFSFRIKHVGITSSGAMTRPGTIAADTSIYPYGTIMHIPGYGYARVEDTGGAIKGQHIDLYRPNHWFARHWGVRTKKVRVWLPPGPPPAPDAVTEELFPEGDPELETGENSLMKEPEKPVSSEPDSADPEGLIEEG